MSPNNSKTQVLEEVDYSDLTFSEKLIFFVKNNKVLVIIFLILVVGVGVYFVVSSANAAKKNEAEIARILDETEKQKSSEAIPEEFDEEGVDKLLIEQQPSLTDKFGTAPEGYIWDVDGSLLSLGDKSLAAEDVLFTYLRALTTLDLDIAQRFSRNSSVISSYSNYFDTRNTRVDSRDQFERDVYRQMMLSMQVQGINNTSSFSANKKVFTVKANVLDLSDKSFWEKDYDTLMQNVYAYTKGESDREKANQYLYGYIMKHYQSLKPTKEVTFDITLTKSVALNSGWLITIDNDLDNLFKNQDGYSVVNYINDAYRDYSAAQQ